MSNCPHVVTSDEGTSYCRLAEFPRVSRGRVDYLSERLRGAASQCHVQLGEDQVRYILACVLDGLGVIVKGGGE